MMAVRKAFHEELQDIDAEVVALTEQVVSAIERGTDMFLSGEIGEVDELVRDDLAIDARMSDIEVRVCAMFARQQPMAGDLRRLLAVLRIIHDLERCGDYMVNIVKAARRLYPVQLDPSMASLIDRMRTQAVVQVRAASRSFQERDASLAAALSDMDDVMDDLQKDLLRKVFSSSPDEDGLQQAVQVALVGRYFERIADHAVNVAERVVFMVTGHPLDGQTPSVGDID